MPQNLELKARVSSLSEALHIAHRLHAREKGTLQQRDIYYQVPRGRLKLRILNKRSAEMIYYTRPDKRGGRYSQYLVVPVKNAALTNVLCSSAFGQKVIVTKKRRLLIYKNSRIHLDQVRGLGIFIEFEVLVKNGKQQAQKLLKKLCKEFAIIQTGIIGDSYSDMLIRKRGRLKK
ncbi:MAG: CYTH domain-containing protein [Ignavibacteriae bacterium]|nr:MAG: CYTH domain-containing protein [Ignavibacteriota bacterium]